MLLPAVGSADAQGRRLLSLRETRLPQAVQSVAQIQAATQTAAPVCVDGGYRVGNATIDARGQLQTLNGMTIRGPELVLWHAPTDNDEGHGPLDYFHTPPTAQNLGAGSGRSGASSADRWRQARLHLLHGRHLSTEIRPEIGASGALVTRTRYSAPSMGWAVDTVTILEGSEAGLSLRVEMNPAGDLPNVLPRLGIRLGLPKSLNETTWTGQGPGLSYPDLQQAARTGHFHSTVAGMWEETVRPQESGTRQGLVQLQLSETNDGVEAPRLQVVNRSSNQLAFSLSPWDVYRLPAAGHVEELVEDDVLWLHLDAYHNGIGSRSCGPDVRPEAQAQPRRGEIQVLLAAQ